MALCLLSLAGIPRLAGFAGKVFVLSAATDGGMTWLAVIAAVNMAIGLFYYVRVIAEMYFEASLRHELAAGGIWLRGQARPVSLRDIDLRHCPCRGPLAQQLWSAIASSGDAPPAGPGIGSPTGHSRLLTLYYSTDPILQARLAKCQH